MIHLCSTLSFLSNYHIRHHHMIFSQLAITIQGRNYLTPQTPHTGDHLKVIISNDLLLTDLFLPDDQTRFHLRSISRDIHYNPRRLHSSLPTPPVLLMVFHSSPRAQFTREGKYKREYNAGSCSLVQAGGIFKVEQNVFIWPLRYFFLNQHVFLLFLFSLERNQ